MKSTNAATRHVPIAVDVREANNPARSTAAKKQRVKGSFPTELLAVALFVTALNVIWMNAQVVHGVVAYKFGLGISIVLPSVSALLWIITGSLLVRTYRESASVAERERMLQEHQLLRAIVDNLPDDIYAKDIDGRYVLSNVAHARALGVESPDQLRGKTDSDFFPRDVAELYRASEEEIVRSGKPLLNHEEIKCDKLGIAKWISTSKVLWRDKDGNLLGFAGVSRDIHESKMAREKMQKFSTQLERSNRELQDFAYVASHDLQEPLRKIIVFGERLKDKCGDEFPPESRDYLDRMQKAATRMQALINDLLSFSRLTSKAQPFRQVNLALVAQDVVGDLEARIEQVRGRVEIGSLPVVDAEPFQMRQLLQNLIGNALKFRRPDEPPVVKLSAEIINAPRPRVQGYAPAEPLCRLTVSDNGIGFDEKYLDRIFNVFQRLHTRSEYEGTGMGLAIVRKIAMHHGGDVTASSTPGEGSTFIVTLPISHPKDSSHE